MLLLHGAVLPLAHIRRTQTRPPIFLRRVNKLIMQTGPARTARQGKQS